MGQTLSKKEEELRVAKDLNTLEKLREKEGKLRKSLESTKNKLYIRALNDECLPIVCAVDKFDGFYVDLKDEIVTKDHIKKILERHLTTDYLDGVITLMEGVLKNMLTETTTPEPTERLHVVLANKSVLRIDYYVHVEIDEPLKVLVYYVQVGVLDIARVRRPVLQYELSLAMDDQQREAASAELDKMAAGKLNDAVDKYYTEIKEIESSRRKRKRIADLEQDEQEG